MFDKLRVRIMLLNLGVTSLVMFTAFSAIFAITSAARRNEALLKLNNIGNVGFDNYKLENSLPSAYSLSFMLSVSNDGRLLDAYSMCDYPDAEGFEAAALFALERGSGEFEYYNSYWLFRVYDDSDGRRGMAFIEITSDKAAQIQLLLTLVFVGAVALIVIWIFSAFFAKRVIRPISDAWERQKRFVADASHELKTPLMTILANYDVLEANEGESVKSQMVWLEPIKLGADRMGALVADLLTLARAEGSGVSEEKKPFDISGLIGEVTQSMSAAAKAKNLSVNVAAITEREFYGYADSVRQVFAIIYENAVKYSNEGGAIDISVTMQKKQAVLRVRNTGSGIAPKDLPRIFDRFYRADAARSADDNSYGLGLSIARGVAERCGWQLTAKSAEGEWAEFSLRFEASRKARS